MVCFGSNDEGQCGRLEGTVNSSDTETTVRSVDAWTCPSGRHIVKTVASDAASFVLLDDGSLWGWGTLMCNNLTNHEREMGDMDEADVTEVWGHLDPSTPLCYYPESPEFGIVDVSAASHFVCFIMRNGMIGVKGIYYILRKRGRAIQLLLI